MGIEDCRENTVREQAKRREYAMQQKNGKGNYR